MHYHWKLYIQFDEIKTLTKNINNDGVAAARETKAPNKKTLEEKDSINFFHCT